MKKAWKLALAAASLAMCASASAAPVFVGSWNLYGGQGWWTGTAPTYTAQEAAALLFGGIASDYVVSTAGNSVAAINYSAWYDRYAIGPGVYAQDYRVDSGTLGVYDRPMDSSAYIRDNASGNQHMNNYAFRVENTNQVPEPLTVGLLGLGLAGMAAVRRKAK